MEGNYIFSRWTFFQIIIIFFLLALAYTLDYFKEILTELSVDRNLAFMLLYFSFIIVVVACANLFLVLQTKKSSTFLIHPLWRKMHVIISFIFLVSMITLISLFVFTPIYEIVQRRPWLLFLVGYYFLFLFNLLILCFIHRFENKATTREKKIERSFFGTILLLLVVLYFLPSF